MARVLRGTTQAIETGMANSDSIQAGERTQEEWHAFKPAESNGYVYVQSDAGEEICTCYTVNADANAGRIAALPELLEALRECRSEITRLNAAAGETVFNPMRPPNFQAQKMTTLLILNSKGRTFRAEASISQAELPTMRQCGEIVGYIVKAEPDKVGAPVPDLNDSSEVMMRHFHGK